MQKIKYITNRDLLAEIKICKASFCRFLLPEYSNYDVIVTEIGAITPGLLTETMTAKAAQLSTKVMPVSVADIPPESIVFRVMTDAHLPPIDVKKRRVCHPGGLIKTNFNPFRHYILRDGALVEVGRSHWRGDFETGRFNVDHGKINNKLACMFILLVDQYAKRGNWRSYCADFATEALTRRGWLNMDEINETDIILAYDAGTLKWSKIKSIYRGEYHGKMFKLDAAGMDALVTPGHKFVTDKGLKTVELLLETDRVILMGDAVHGGANDYSDAFIELVGRAVTEGAFLTEAAKADRLRACVNHLQPGFGDDGSRGKELCAKLSEVASGGVPTMAFILSLTEAQRELLIQTMVDRKPAACEQDCGGHDKRQLDAFLMLCTLNGYRTTIGHRDIVGESTAIDDIDIDSKTNDHRCVMVEQIDFHGGKTNGTHPNQPTVDYTGRVWCPETEYGSFMARRNGAIYISVNSYNDEMKSQAIVQLTQVGLQFDESRSSNPFSFFTQIVKNSFRRILNLEKRSQHVRDELLIMAGAMPSYTRQVDNEIEQRESLESGDMPSKRGRRPKVLSR